ncbi:MAG: helix-turn-helix domain-containing protein [Tannerella sp.]|nr:helix-turn-helix domain-containing protein [Tannerella sp.]
MEFLGKYRKITVDDVWCGSSVTEAEAAAAGKHINKYRNYATNNDFIDHFAALLRIIGYRPLYRYAASMGVGRQEFHHAVLALTGWPPKKWIDEFTLRRIREYMEKGRSSFGVAHSLGFVDTATFSHYFHRHFGMSLREWMDG